MSASGVLKIIDGVVNNPIKSKELNNLLVAKYKHDADLYLNTVYQMLGLILKENITIDDLIKMVREDKTEWNSVVFDTIRECQLERDKFTENPFSVDSDGVSKCKHCGSYRTKAMLIQTRSGDEQATNITYCTKCGKTSKY